MVVAGTLAAFYRPLLCHIHGCAGQHRYHNAKSAHRWRYSGKTRIFRIFVVLHKSAGRGGADKEITQRKEGRSALNFLASMDPKSVADVSITLITMLNDCLEVGSRHVLPSVARGAVWSAFHQLRNCDALKQPWNLFITSYVPEAYQVEHPLALQLIVAG